jgi:hygromycin-B 7''-O-kinase
MKLPDLDVNEFIHNFRLKPEAWLFAITETCLKHHLVFKELSPFTSGSNLVAAADNRYVIKIFPPFQRHQWDSEYKVLEFLQDKLSFPVPELIAYGERPDQWTYIVVTLLEGITLDHTWNNCSKQNRLLLLQQIGAMMAEVHALPSGNLPILQPAWPNFLEQQLQTFQARHIKQSMPGWFIEQCTDYVNEAVLLLPHTAKPVLLTGEYTPFNLLSSDTNHMQTICGMIDFGDAMTGFNEYDLLGPLMFLAAGDEVLIHSLLKGYGYSTAKIDTALRHRLIGFQILHRYSDFDRQLKITDWQNKVKSMKELEELIWPIT